MSKGQGGPRKPATKFPQLRKKMEKATQERFALSPKKPAKKTPGFGNP